MIQIHVKYCACCDARVCRRCGQCHLATCEDHVVICRVFTALEKPIFHRRRRSMKRGAQRRLKRRVI